MANELGYRAIKPRVSYASFASLDLRVGRVESCEPLANARKPAYALMVDFGEGLGKLRSSAQITDLYKPEDLLNRQVIAVVNFPDKRIASFSSQCLILGVPNENGEVVLLRPDSFANSLADSLVASGVRVF